ncbi:ATP-dependent Clp protease proteolytic subunit [Alloiococcus sp. CFN-8]|uniref:ATP-dependent Clp protease proteolytic subunit n=1 Tax=Alloiococcus sp. CFN-8 TaxID=3416081 RepID=UPI003CF52B0D
MIFNNYEAEEKSKNTSALLLEKQLKSRSIIISGEINQALAEKVNKDTERDFWMNAEEALSYGIVSKIITSESQL